MTLRRQIIIIVAFVLMFVLFDLSIYIVFTKRCISDYSEGMQAKSIEVDKYLPFEENSQIVKLELNFELSGDIPIIDGAAAFYPVYSAFVNACYPESSVIFDGENFTADSAMQYTNTRGAFKALADGTIDIAICLEPSKEQLAYAEEQGVKFEMRPIGRDAFVFIVNSNNPVESLTVDEIKGIYSGKYRKWSELGGNNRLIGALQRNEGSGSQTTMLAFMGDTPIKKDYDSFLGSSIGFSFRYYVEGIVGDSGVKMISVNGVYPSAENIANGSYPVISEFYAIYRKDNKNENVPLLIEWMLSEEGQRIVEESGYVRVN